MPIKFLNDVAVDSNVLYVDTINNRVGVGTSSPDETFTLQTQATGLGSEGVFIKNPFAGTTPIVNSKSPFLSLGTSTASAYNSTIYMGRNATATNQESKIEWSNANNGLSIYVAGQGSYREHVRFGDLANSTARTFFNGNVGIGATSPSQKLHVSGNLRVTGAYYDSNNSPGTSGQVLSSIATGTDWIDQGDIIVGEADKAKSVVLRVKNSTASPMTKGQVICEAVSASPPSGNLIEVALADNNGTNTMPALGILNEDLDAAGGANDEGDAIMFGKVSGIDTSAFSVGDEVFVSDTPGGLTITKPTGVKYIQKVGVVIRDDNTNGTIEVFGAGRVNDVPTPLYVDHANQRLGIGATSPITKLEINGPQHDANFTSGSLMIKQAATGSRIFIDGNDIDSADGILFLNDYSRNPVRVSDDLQVPNGNVGIGTTSPSHKLDVVGTSEFSERLLFNKTVNTGSLTPAFYNSHTGFSLTNDPNYQKMVCYGYDANNNPIFQVAAKGYASDVTAAWNNDAATRFTVLAGGNVGIGTTSPAAKLEVEGGNHLFQLSTTSSTGDPYLSFNQAGTRRSFIQHADSGDTLKIVSEYGGIDFFTGTIGVETERMTIQSGGNVGIGTTNPTGKLEVRQAANNGNTGAFTNTHVKLTASATADNTGFVGITAATSTSDNYGYSFGAQRTSGGVGSFKINYHNGIAAGVNRFIIDQNGNVGIGTTSPQDKLDVNGDIAIKNATQLSFDSNNGTLSVASDAGQVNLLNSSIFINYSSNVGIGTTTPSSKLQVNGGVQLANDTAAASASKVGTFRYRTSGNNSYVDMCMQTGAAAYAWVNIVTNSW